jgi:hypothetical protein
LAEVSGSVREGTPVVVNYDRNKFQEDGKLVLHTARTPRNETCLQCHQKPGWKKRGADFSPRLDVHLSKGLRCVDCHTAGRNASDPRIRGKEVHQFGKGDDPGGFVRNDLDNTVRDCNSCHSEGTMGAPIANHSWLPPLHMKKIACQTCHIPKRYVKAALVQASDVYNPAPHISPPGKKIWTFYDQQGNFWNHYGDYTMFTYADQPNDPYLPTLINYKGKIYPGNQLHGSFVGYETEGKPGIQQLFMRDFVGMWNKHRSNPQKYFPQLAKIRDHNGDGAIEVNSPEEIDALLSSTKEHLQQTNYPLDGKRLVWVANSRAYYSSTESRPLERLGHEATAYASVFKYSHGVAPARSALGAGGCTDCHRVNSPFFNRPVLKQIFQENGQALWQPNYTILGYSSLLIYIGSVREQWLKPLLYLFCAVLLILLIAYRMRKVLVAQSAISPDLASLLTWLFIIACSIGGVIMGDLVYISCKSIHPSGWMSIEINGDE